jgi:integrase
MSVWYDKQAKRYRIRIKRRGQDIRETLPDGISKAQAEARHNEVLREFFNQSELGKPAKYLIDDAIVKYIEEEIPKQKSGEKTLSNIRAIRPYVTGFEIGDIGARSENFRNASRGRFSIGTINRRLAVLRRIANLAFKRWGYLDRPVDIPLEPGETKREIYLTKTQINALVKEAQTREVKDWIMIAAYTGMRRSEIHRLQPTDVKAGVINVRITKTGKSRLVPAIKKIKGPLSRLPFKTDIFKLDKLFRMARKRARMPHVRFHDLRHTTASLLLAEGVPLTVIGMILGHSDPRTTQRYAHLSIDHLKVAMAKLGA